MFKLYGFFTQNTLKALYVLEEMNSDFEFNFVNLAKGEHKSEEFRKMTPIGKVPVLAHNGEYLFESGAICRYVANATNSPLYPDDPVQRAQVDQWMDFFSCHLGRWLSKLYFEKNIKPSLNLGEPDVEGIEEAKQFAQEQLGMLNSHFADTDWLANDAVSIADISAFAYVEQCQAIDYPLADFPNVQAWVDRVAARSSIADARAKLP